jgi:hypothetical protein
MGILSLLSGMLLGWRQFQFQETDLLANGLFEAGVPSRGLC